MKIPQLSLLEWQQRFGTEEASVAEFVQVRWPDGFICPECAARDYSFVITRHVYQCCNCYHQASVTSGMIFHSTNLPLVK